MWYSAIPHSTDFDVVPGEANAVFYCPEVHVVYIYIPMICKSGFIDKQYPVHEVMSLMQNPLAVFQTNWKVIVVKCLSSFSNLSVTSPTSQLILQPFRRFTYVTAHSPTLPSLYLRRSSFSNPSVALPTSQLSPTLPSLYLRRSSFSNPSVASPTSQLSLQPFRCFT